MASDAAESIDATVLLVGQGVLADALARRLPRVGLELQRASAAQAAQLARVIAPDLVVLVGDAAGDGGKRVLAQLSTEASAAELPVLVICGPALATLGGITLRTTVAALAPEGGIDICALRIQQLIEALAGQGLAGRTLQQTVDAVAGAAKQGAAAAPVSPRAEHAPQPAAKGSEPKRRSPTLVGIPSPLAAAAAEPAASERRPSATAARTPAAPDPANAPAAPAVAAAPATAASPRPAPAPKPAPAAIAAPAATPADAFARTLMAMPAPIAAPASAPVATPTPEPAAAPRAIAAAAPALVAAPAPAAVAATAAARPTPSSTTVATPKTAPAVTPAAAPAVAPTSAKPVARNVAEAAAPAAARAVPPTAAAAPAPIEAVTAESAPARIPARFPAASVPLPRSSAAPAPEPLASASAAPAIDVDWSEEPARDAQTPLAWTTEAGSAAPPPRAFAIGTRLRPRGRWMVAAGAAALLAAAATVIVAMRSTPHDERVGAATGAIAPAPSATMRVAAATAGPAPRATAARTAATATKASSAAPQRAADSARNARTAVPHAAISAAHEEDSAHPGAVRDDEDDEDDEDSSADAPARVRPELRHKIAVANRNITQGHRLLRRGQLGMAEAAYLKALAVLPRYPRAMAGLARVHLRRKDGAEAVRWAERLVKQQPRRGNNQLLLGDAWALRGQPARARAAWQRAAAYGNAAARSRLK